MQKKKLAVETGNEANHASKSSLIITACLHMQGDDDEEMEGEQEQQQQQQQEEGEQQQRQQEHLQQEEQLRLEQQIFREQQQKLEELQQKLREQVQKKERRRKQQQQKEEHEREKEPEQQPSSDGVDAGNADVRRKRDRDDSSVYSKTCNVTCNQLMFAYGVHAVHSSNYCVTDMLRTCSWYVTLLEHEVHSCTCLRYHISYCSAFSITC